jgi:HSP20 family protein
MSLKKYEPLNLLSRMQSQLNDFFHRADSDFPSLFEDDQMLVSSDWMPRIDVKEDDAQYTITADVPGVDSKDINVTMENGMLCIKGERRTEKEEKKKNYHRRECVMGSFERSFLMPDNADKNKISAKGKNGVITIQIGKKEVTKPKSINIQYE